MGVLKGGVFIKNITIHNLSNFGDVCMKVKITGLDCPNCAKALEQQINKINDVNNAQIDFFASTLSFESKDENKALKHIIKLARKVEPDVQIAHYGSEKNRKIIIDIITLALGVVLGIITLYVPMSKFVFWPMFAISAIILGYKTYIKAIMQLFKGIVNENLLITISVIGASAIGNESEGLMVIILYSVGKLLENLAIEKSRRSIASLTQMQPNTVTVIKDGQKINMNPEQVEKGSIILVRAGERVALDGKIINGNASLDCKSLTGESLPVFAKPNDEILSGSIVLDGTLEIKVTNGYKDCTVKKILDLIEHAQEKKSKTETMISKIARYYTLIVIAMSVIVFGIVWAVLKDFDTALYRGLIFLVASCPCAFAISVPLAYFSGLGNASKNGVLIKGSNFLDSCAKLNLVAFDKTGTLSTGEFEIEKIIKKTSKDILYIACLGEQYSIHPIAKALLNANKKKLKKINNIKEIAGKGVSYQYQEHDYFIGRKNKKQKSTIVEVYEDQQLLGEIVLVDSVKPTSKSAIQKLKQLNVKPAMLSGDNLERVEEVAKILDIEEYYARMLPKDKFDWLEEKKKNNTIAYVGDGINDAPALTLCDVGFSMGIKGSDSSIEASDIVIVDDNPEKVATAIKLSKYTRKIVWQNIIFIAMVKLAFLALGAVGITGMAFAVVADVGVTVMAILNSLRALHKKTD